MVGRSLRAVTDLAALGERQIVIDCDVIQADGGTRTASVTGGFVALSQCIAFMKKTGMVTKPAIKDHVAAVSCGIWQGTPVLDLDYAEDSSAETDANFVLTGAGGLVEIQGTAEGAPFSEEELAALVQARAQGHRRIDRIAEDRFWHEARTCPGRGKPQSRQGARDQAFAGAVRRRNKGAAELGLPEPEETGNTFAENAALKARAAAQRERASIAGR